METTRGKNSGNDDEGKENEGDHESIKGCGGDSKISETERTCDRQTPQKQRAGAGEVA